MPPRVHVIGAGLSGLAAAVELVAAGRPVSVYEQAGHAGGRCRSFFDDSLGRTIDNGNHLVLSGNRSIAAYVARIGAADRLIEAGRAAFPFVDLLSGERWTIRPAPGRIPWWILSRSRRVPGTVPTEYLSAVRLARAPASATVTDCVGRTGVLYRRFWEPLAVSALNTAAEEGSARLLWPVLRETFGRGEAACRPLLTAHGLGHCFVEPALAFLRQSGTEIQFHARLRGIETDAGVVNRLGFAGGEEVNIARGDVVVLAVPPSAAVTLVPGLVVPNAYRAIVNAHFRVRSPIAEPDFLGVIGGAAHWIFRREDVVSVTVSAADGLAAETAEVVTARLWPEVCSALSLPDAEPAAVRIVKEKRATFAQTPIEAARRPACRTRLTNLFLAGDWTDTGLPATIEGSVRSGHTAAGYICESSSDA